ncbi:MAG: alpha/beta hydrolase [Anaerolineae bacterium]
MRDEYIHLRGLRFHYREAGDPAAPPLVFLHGLASQGRSWDTVAEALLSRYRTLALDQRGHGETDWADDYAAEAMVEDVAAFVDALHLDKIGLVGFSMGGRNAYMYAARDLARIEKLVIMDIGPELMPAGADRVRAAVQAPDVFEDPEHAFWLTRLGNARPPDDVLRARVYHNLVQREDGLWTWRYDKAFRSPDRPLPRPDPVQGWAMLRAITAPTLVIRAAESDVLAKDTAERMARELPDGRLVEIPFSGHNIALDNPDALIAVLREFLFG